MTIQTKDLIEFLFDASSGITSDSNEREMRKIIIHRLKYLDQLKEEVSNTYAGITASELFENNDL